MLAALQHLLMLGLAGAAFQTQCNLLGGLGFLVEHWFGLTTITSLLTVVTALTLSIKRCLAGFVLGNLLGSVLFALFAKSVASLGNVHLQALKMCTGQE